MNSSSVDLAGCRVWLTRPRERAGSWRAALEAAGARVSLEPLLVIAPPDDPARAANELDRAEQADIVIATSANAVAGMQRLRPRWAPRGRLLAVGSATAQALGEHTARDVAIPDINNSEGVLAISTLADIQGRRIAILAGHGGRELLAERLTARGARVDKLALYRRVAADISPARLDTLIDRNEVVILTSVEAWQSLRARLSADQRTRLAALGLVAASYRVIQQSGYDIDWSVDPVVIDRMDADGAVRALDRIRSARRQ